MGLALASARRIVEVDCTVDLEQTNDSLHAWVDLDGYDVGPGDEVLVIDAPTDVPFGERQIHRRKAVVIPASAWERFKAKLQGYRELTELYEVGFEEKTR